MPNILDEAVRIANQEYLTRTQADPTAPEMKRASDLVGRVISGRATASEKIVLSRLLQKIGTSTREVFAALNELQ